MKKWTSLLFVAVVMLFLTAKIASAQTVTPKLVLDGKELNPPEPPALVGNFTMVPIRVVGESLGYKVDYDSGTKKVTVKSDTSVVEMVINQTKATIDGKSVALQAPPTAKSGTTLIPLRFVGESLGLQVYWENASKSVFLYSNGKSGAGNGSGSGSGGTNGSGSSGGSHPGDGGLVGVVTPEDGSEGDEGDGSVVTNPTGTLTQLHSVSFEDGDTIVLKYDGGFLLPKTSVLTGPDRIVVDLPSADFASDFSPALPTDDGMGVKPLGELAVTGHEALQKIRYSLFSDNPRTIRFVLDLSKKWGYELTNDAAAGELKIKLQEPSAAPAQPGSGGSGVYTVVLDAGHGGSDPGAPSITGKWEKDFTLAVILKLRDLLAKDSRLNVVLTRSSDTYPTLADRYNLANSLNASLFLSVHGNSNTKNTVKGAEVYYTRTDSLAFANVVHQYAVPATGMQDRGVIQKSLAVTRETKMPAVLYEAGYLSNADDEKKMYTEDFQNKLAQGLATAIKKYLQLS
ncbi:N-acetylmuramoyl-L-alanine amidase family protein [Cohnella thermotolerans]|uniref:N-acetylmuramoyl-L-alanine amidase family protein n=1 Tax=Cohnella thermotolerans TaxID=329858 RepID=UPI00040A038B|nr:N-acetylmuramoyl-L-alanine amidase family protein [Cohnella thermotolerans]